MKRILVLAVLFSLFTALSGEAKMIDIFEFTGTFDTSQIGPLTSYDLYMGLDSPVLIGHVPASDFNTTVMTTAPWYTSILASILDGSYVRPVPPPSGDTAAAELDAMWSSQTLWGKYLFNGTYDFGGFSFSNVPFPDLTGYHINDLYLASNIGLGVNSFTYDLALVADADAAPVPEPSTLALLVAGLAGACFWKLRRETVRTS